MKARHTLIGITECGFVSNTMIANYRYGTPTTARNWQKKDEHHILQRQSVEAVIVRSSRAVQLNLERLSTNLSTSKERELKVSSVEVQYGLVTHCLLFTKAPPIINISFFSLKGIVEWNHEKYYVNFVKQGLARPGHMLLWSHSESDGCCIPSSVSRGLVLHYPCRRGGIIAK
jgi:hypothetical protein